MVAIEKDSGAIASISLPSKEATPFAAEFVASFIDRLGLTTVTLRTDGEPAIVKLAELVKGRRTHGTSLQQAPKHSSASIGAVERAHWEIQSQTTTRIAQMRPPTKCMRTPRGRGQCAMLVGSCTSTW